MSELLTSKVCVAVSIGKELRGCVSSLKSYVMCLAVSRDEMLKKTLG